MLSQVWAGQWLLKVVGRAPDWLAAAHATPYHLCGRHEVASPTAPGWVGWGHQTAKPSSRAHAILAIGW